MTLIVFAVAHGTRTPLALWFGAMVCDTVLLSVYMVAKAIHS